MVAKAVHSGFKQHLGNEATFWADIGTKVNRSKWHLGTSAAVHRVEIMNKALHSLECLMLGIIKRCLDDALWHLGFFEFLFVAKSDVVFNFNFKIFTSKLFVFLEVFFEGFAESFVDGWRHRSHAQRA